jgi:hypothetical protein
MLAFDQAKSETEEFFAQFAPQFQEYKEKFYQKYQNYCAINHDDYQELENTWFWNLELEEPKETDKKVEFLKKGREILRNYYNLVEEAKDTISYNRFIIFLREGLFNTFLKIIKLKEELSIE